MPQSSNGASLVTESFSLRNWIILKLEYKIVLYKIRV